MKLEEMLKERELQHLIEVFKDEKVIVNILVVFSSLQVRISRHLLLPTKYHQNTKVACFDVLREIQKSTNR